MWLQLLCPQKPHFDEKREPDTAGMLEFIKPEVENNFKHYGKGDSMQDPGDWWVSREKQILRKKPKRSDRGSSSARLHRKILTSPLPVYTLNWFFFLISYFNLWLHCMAHGILTPWPGIEPVPPALEDGVLNHWTSGEVPLLLSFFFFEIPNLSGTISSERNLKTGRETLHTW